MADIVIFDEAARPQRVLSYLKSVHTPDYMDRPGVVINPDLNDLDGVVARKYWKHEEGKIVEYTEAEKTAQDLANATSADTAIRLSAKSQLDGFLDGALFKRALVAVLMDELNTIRATQGVSLPALTVSSLLSDINTKIDGGSVD